MLESPKLGEHYFGRYLSSCLLGYVLVFFFCFERCVLIIDIEMAEPLKALQVEMEAPASSVRVQGIAKMMEARAAGDAGLFDGGPHPASNPIPNRIKFYNSHLGPVILSSGIGKTTSVATANDFVLLYPHPVRFPEELSQLTNVCTLQNRSIHNC